jgi:DNA modification methylase
MSTPLGADGIFAGSCLELLPKLDAQSVDLTCFSPPYDDIRSYRGFELDLSALGAELYRVSKDGAVAAVVIGDATVAGEKSLTTAELTVDWVRGHGWRLFECCIYSRFGRPGAWWNQRFRVDHESILFFVKGQKPKYFNKEPLKVKAKHAGATWHGTTRLSDGTLTPNEPKVQADTKCRGTIWHYAASNTEGNRLKLEHPGTYPDDLAADIIKCFSTEGDLVLDPTVGSGTTAVMAKLLGRRYLGMDISEDYCKIARERLEREAGDSIL